MVSLKVGRRKQGCDSTNDGVGDRLDEEGHWAIFDAVHERRNDHQGQ